MLPNMTVMAPKDENELQHMLKTAMNHRLGPVAIRYPRGAGVGVPLDTLFHLLPWGKGEILKEGNDMAVLLVGPNEDSFFTASCKFEKKGLLVKEIKKTVLNTPD